MEDRAAWKCHSCGQGGDIFNLLELLEKCDRAGALRRAAELAGVDLPERSEKKDRSLSVRERIFIAAAEHYHDHMLEFGGRAYFVDVRKHSEKTLRQMRAGMATGELLPHLRGLGFSDADILESGLVKDHKEKGGLRDYWWKGLAIFPVFDSDGKVITLTMKDPAGAAKHAMPPGGAKDWFLNHAALAKFTELIIVEGQNDGASLHDAGIDNWIGTAGQPSKEQILLLRNFGTKKYFYLWFDKDPEKNQQRNEGGPGHTRKIYEALQEQEYHVKILDHPGTAKDPDKYLLEVLAAGGDPKAAVRALKEGALNPLKWEIALIRQLPTRDERLIALEQRKIFRAVNDLSDIEQEAYVEALCALDFSEKAIRQKLESEVSLLEEVEAYRAEVGKNVNGLQLAEICYKWFAARGKFFRTLDGKVWLLYRHKIEEISDNISFRSLLAKLTRLSLKEAPGKQLYDFLQTLCYDRGEPIEVVSWIHTVRETDTIYINFNSPKSEILKIAPSMDPVAIPNGTNKEGVLLSNSLEIKPFEFLPGATEAEGFAALKEYLFDNLSCERDLRYFVLCWVIFVFMIDFNKNKGLLHCLGASASGKSTAVSLASQLIYGQDLVGQASAAASFSEGANAPLVIQDNIENRDLTKQMVNFLLLAANSAMKKKRKGGTDSGTVHERVNGLVVLTSIEPIPGSIPELVNRIFPVIFQHEFQRAGFVEDEASRGLLKKRNTILSAILKTVAHKVLPRLQDRSDWLKYIQKEFPKHNKSRSNEFMGTILLILEAVLGFIPYYPKGTAGGDEKIEIQARDVLHKWVGYWDNLADETNQASNSILNLLDGLYREVYAAMRHKDLQTGPHSDYDDPVFIFHHDTYLLEFIKTQARPATALEALDGEPDEENTKVQYFEFIATSSELHTVFNLYCKNNGARNPFDGPSALGARIANDRKLIGKGGWQLVTTEGKAPYYRIRSNGRYWKFSRRMDLGGR